MRICLVADSSSIHTKRWAKYFVKRGHELQIISIRPGKINGATVYYVGPYEPPSGITCSSVSQALRISYITRKLVKKLKPDILHGHYLTDSGFFAAFTKHHPFVVSPWGSDVLVYPAQSRISKLIAKYVLRRADKIHSVSTYLTKKIIALGADPNKIITVPIGIDLNKFRPDKAQQDKIENVIISTRTLSPIYNVGLLIRAVPYIIKEIQNAKIIIVGDGAQKNDLIATACKLQVHKYIDFVGRIEHENIPKMLAAAKVYVSTSLSDSLGISNLEAMGCGVFPVIVDRPAVREWITNGVNGFLVPPNDPKMLARKIVDAINDEKLRDFAEKKNLEIIQKKAGWEENMIQIERLYNNILEV